MAARTDRDTKKVRDLAKRHGVTAVDTLRRIMVDEKSPSASRIAAATALLDRGFGRVAPSPADAGTPSNPIHVKLGREDSEL